MKRRSNILIIAVALLAAVPGLAAPQDVEVATNAEEARTLEAQALEARAAELAMDRQNGSEAIALYLEAADLREDSDPVGARDLAAAATLLFYADRLGDAVSTMERAAKRAQKADMIALAAHTYIDAAHIAVALHNTGMAVRLVGEARRLADSRKLTEEERKEIRKRIFPTRLPPFPSA